MASPKRRFLQEPHGVTSQKTPFFECNTNLHCPRVKTSHVVLPLSKVAKLQQSWLIFGRSWFQSPLEMLIFLFHVVLAFIRSP
jgi:hypothetical protein